MESVLGPWLCRVLLAAMNAFEDRLEEESALARLVLPRVQSVLTGQLRVGNEQVVVGREGWLYFRKAVDHLTGPGGLTNFSTTAGISW